MESTVFPKIGEGEVMRPNLDNLPEFLVLFHFRWLPPIRRMMPHKIAMKRVKS